MLVESMSSLEIPAVKPVHGHERPRYSFGGRGRATRVIPKANPGKAKGGDTQKKGTVDMEISQANEDNGQANAQGNMDVEVEAKTKI